MIALVPVSRYRAAYQVASGRPYSFLDRFVLEAISEGQSSVEMLEATFRIHRRVLLESVVTLMHAGWLALDQESHGLVATSAGAAALGEPGTLPQTILVDSRTDFVLCERVAGQLARSTEATFVPKSELRAHFASAAIVPKGNLPHSVEPGLIMPLLRRREGEWIRWCGPIDIVRDGADYIVVDVNTATGALTGLPSTWLPLLQEVLVERARAKERELIVAGLSPVDPALARLVRREVAGPALDDDTAPDPDEWALDATQERVIVGADKHHDLLVSWLENASSYVCIVSGRLDIETVDRAFEPLRAALGRGVLVDVAWGSEGYAGDQESHRSALDKLKKLEWDSHHSASRGRLNVARTPSHSHAKILLGDVGGAFEAIVGSYDWLAGNLNSPRTDLSLVFRESGPVARLARLVADIAATDERLSSGAGLTRLRHAAADLDRELAAVEERRLAERRKEQRQVEEIRNEPATDVVDDASLEDVIAGDDRAVPGSVSARIVIGRQHQALLPILVRQSRRRVLVACHRWGRDSGAAFRALKDGLERGLERVDVRYGIELPNNDDHRALSAELEKLGGSVKPVSDLHAKVVVSDDDTAVVSSFDWLSPDIHRAHVGVGEIGFILKGDGIGSALLVRLGLIPSEPLLPLEAEYVRRVLIRDVRSIKQLDWNIHELPGPGWHVIIGDNGSGKTSALRAIALALMGKESALALRQDWKSWIRGTQDTAEVSVSLDRQTWIAGNASPVHSAHALSLYWAKADDTVALSEAREDRTPVVSAGYGPFRRFTGGDPEYQKSLAVVPGLAEHISLFDERVALTDSLTWLRELRFRSLENDGEATLLLLRLTTLVNQCGLLPNGIHLVEVTADAVRFADDFGHEFGIEELSDGYRSVLSMTFDIVRQLATRFGAARVFETEHPGIVSAPGIVLIDEVDAHLHPAWQRTIGQWFRRHFPRVQFIVSTHSPLCCQAAEGGTVFRLPDQSDENDSGELLEGIALARLVYGNVLEAYASGAFGESVNRSDTSTAWLDRLAELNRKSLESELSPDEFQEQTTLRAIFPSLPQTSGIRGAE